MISIQTKDGQLIKVINNFVNETFGFHQLFGFTGLQSANKRLQARKRHGHDFSANVWKFHFVIKTTQESWTLINPKNCHLKMIAPMHWQVETQEGIFEVTHQNIAVIPEILTDHPDKNHWMSRLLEILFILTFALIPVLYFLESKTGEESKKEEVKEPIKVTIVKPVDTVKLNESMPNIEVKPVDAKEVSKRAVQKNLSFLGMVGSQDVKKVVGGVPQKLEKATAGAGAGGDAGSGGELVAGLGKGLKKTTVGNTGVAGLGGIGTKGAGGGQGGYGNTLVAAGEGKGISAIAVSGSEMVLEGGLSRYAINATIAKYLSQVRRCYESELKFNPDLQGVVEVNFDINGSGRLNYSKVKKSTLGNEKVEQCITTKMMSWQFPRPKGGVNVNIDYPFMLRPVSR
jgi:hypothetical protein